MTDEKETNDFDAFIGLILGKLYEARPRRMTWNQISFGLGEVAETEEELTRWETWSNTMEWLEREGCIRFEVSVISPYNEFRDVELTEKGFRVLNSTPPALKEKRDEKSLGERLVATIKEASVKGTGKVLEKGIESGAREAYRVVGEIIRAAFS